MMYSVIYDSTQSTIIRCKTGEYRTLAQAREAALNYLKTEIWERQHAIQRLRRMRVADVEDWDDDLGPPDHRRSYRV